MRLGMKRGKRTDNYTVHQQVLKLHLSFEIMQGKHKIKRVIVYLITLFKFK